MNQNGITDNDMDDLYLWEYARHQRYKSAHFVYETEEPAEDWLKKIGELAVAANSATLHAELVPIITDLRNNVTPRLWDLIHPKPAPVFWPIGSIVEITPSGDQPAIYKCTNGWDDLVITDQSVERIQGRLECAGGIKDIYSYNNATKKAEHSYGYEYYGEYPRKGMLVTINGTGTEHAVPNILDENFNSIINMKVIRGYSHKNEIEYPAYFYTQSRG